MFRKFALAALVALGLGSTAKADLLFFAAGNGNPTTNPSGAGGISIAGFDPAPGNILNVGIGTAAQAFTGAGYDPATGNNTSANTTPFQFTAYGQATIPSALSPVNGAPAIGLPGSNLTLVFGVTEQITNAKGPIGNTNSTVTTDLVKNGAVNYFQIFANNTGTNNLTGQGFNNGTLILSGTLNSTINPLVVTNNNVNSGALDQFGTNQYLANQSSGASGGTTISVTGITLNPDFFRLVNGETLNGLLLSTQFVTPFSAVDPSAAFLIGTTNTAVGAPPVTSGAGLGTNPAGTGIGTVNGQPPAAGGGASIQVQGDANLGFQLSGGGGQRVPEPASLAVFAGMMGIGGLVYRRRRTA